MRSWRDRRRGGFRRPARAAPVLAALIGAGAASAEPDRPPVMTVSVVKAKTQCFADLARLDGRFVAREEILVRPEYEGLLLAQILVEDGATVAAGQPIAQLVRPDWLPGLPAKTTMTASAPGLIAYSRLAIGMPASARAEPMFRIIRNGELELVVDAPLPALGRIKPGQIAQVEALDGAEFAGAVRQILPEIDPMTQQGRVRIQLSSAPELKPGAFATATIDAGQSCGAAAPLSAILYGPQGALVQVVRDNRVETRQVTLGLFDGVDAEIRQGLAPGDLVIARAGAFLREGDLVRTAP